MTRILFCLLLLGLPSLALAHDDLDESARLYSEADLEGALAALDRAESSEMTRDELLRLLAQRVLVQTALGNEEAVNTALRQLASLDPDAQLPPEVPPAVQQRFAELAGGARLSLTTAIEPQLGEVEVSAEVHDDPENLTRSIIVGARLVGEIDWIKNEDSVLLPLDGEGELETYAQAIGFGGAVIASDGAIDDPIRRSITPLPTGERSEGSGGGLSTGAIVGIIAAGVVVAAAVVVGILLAGQDDSGAIQPGAPMIEF